MIEDWWFSSNITIHGVMARAVTKTGFSSYLVCIPQQHITNRRSISNASCVCNLDYAKWMQTITQTHFLLFAFSCLTFLFTPMVCFAHVFVSHHRLAVWMRGSSRASDHFISVILFLCHDSDSANEVRAKARKNLQPCARLFLQKDFRWEGEKVRL